MGFKRPAVVVAADRVLAQGPRTIHVVPITGNVRRALPTGVPLTAAGLTVDSAAQCCLTTVVSVERLTGEEYASIGPAGLAQLRSIFADLLDLT